MRPARTLASGVGSASYARYSHGMSASGVLRSVRPALIGGVVALGACAPARVITWVEMRSLPSSIGETTVLTLRGDSGVATQMYFDPTSGVGVITLANGDWRWSRGWPLSRIMDRLFEDADGLV